MIRTTASLGLEGTFGHHLVQKDGAHGEEKDLMISKAPPAPAAAASQRMKTHQSALELQGAQCQQPRLWAKGDLGVTAAPNAAKELREGATPLLP